MARKVTHILNWKTANQTVQKTLCGRETGRALGVKVGAEIAANPHDANCLTCRKIRDGRGSGW